MYASRHNSHSFKSHAAILLGIVVFWLTGCHWQNRLHPPTIQITRVPAADTGGPLELDYIEGKVSGAAAGQQVVLYARSGVWWIQPFRKQPFTRIQPDSTWKNSTHLGMEYAALLVDSGYVPQAKLTSLPERGNGVLAVASAKGLPTAPISSKTIHFSGYDWKVRSAENDRGGESNFYDPANAWIDEKGYLHLRMEERGDHWTCAEVDLTRSLGYGTYRFVIQESRQQQPSTVLGMLIWDEMALDATRKELDIELSQWGNPDSQNAQYVVQPYYLPGNVARFTVPGGVSTHIIRWEPRAASFKTMLGDGSDARSKSVAEHIFTAGIPTPGAEKVHLSLYRFKRAKGLSQRPAEVVIEKFQYLP